VLGTAVESTAADVNAVVEAAAAAFTDPAWRGLRQTLVVRSSSRSNA
jgi:acyl-CoA reductase-like NAD-dependent aldehyde dehydrogenase